MEKNFERLYHEIETNHFWFRSRRKYIKTLLSGCDKNSKILDIGCSTGILIQDLEKSGYKINNLYGVDISEKAIKKCKENGINNSFVIDAQHIELNNKFDVIISSDCLEHLNHDLKALNNWQSLLNDNGILIVFVPAYMFLWSEHDTVNMHKRRYKKSELVKKLKEVGFEIEKSSYWNFLLFFPIVVYRLLQKIFKSKNQNNTGSLKKPSIFNSLLFEVLNFENKLLKYINFPFGVSVYCIAKKSNIDKIEQSNQ